LYRFSISLCCGSINSGQKGRNYERVRYADKMDEPVAIKLPKMDRPTLSISAVLASILGFWLFYVIIVSLRASVMDFPAQGELAYRRAIVTLVGILVTIILWQVISLFDGKELPTRIVATIISAIPCAFAIALVNYYFFNVYDTSSLFDEAKMEHYQFGNFMIEEIAEVAISRYFFLVAWAALYLAMSYAHDLQVGERRTAIFAQAAQQAELRALRYQVNPHFLFNTLNSLSSLVMTDRKAEAEAMIINLSSFFRTSLSDDPSSDVTLAEEIALQRLYLDMEAVRFPDRLAFFVDVPEALEKAAVPGLILQPLVENAIKHGVARTTKSVTICITADEEGGRLILTVSNDGPIQTAISSPHHGIGLANVRDRLAARFGEGAFLRTSAPVAGGFSVTLAMPLIANGG
jgi:two-component system, LytTR family, sensor kinase